ncbi:glycosyltransferase family 4 protein [Anaeromyxobacter oryzae]|uniref:Glycosyl transferase group 1 n=1 Tax=Anaeromyxobacter oryzae TaxID=2918170 RepID=A0ABM7WS85_9BACT|nr:glycosyltransferase family 4 protein [Anaeromyxobacter oryzae]BDG02303.1 hypothetical protein AMOR_12990 [Anaeromyxobacter oryzae]
MLVPYLLALPGGVRRVLGDGLPRLDRCDVRYVELGRNQADMDEMAAAGVAVDRTIGVPGRGMLSERAGVGRVVDLARAAPRLLAMVLRLRPALRASDVAYVHGFRELLLVVLARAGLAPRHRPAVVWHCHGEISRRRAGVARRLARACHSVIAVSDHTARTLARLGIPEDRIVRIHNAVPQRAGASSSAGDWLRPERPLLVASAALREKKGAHVAVEALAALPQAYVLWVTGDDADASARACAADLRSRAERLGVAQRLRFLGYVRDVPTLMRDVYAVLCPSVWDEPFGLVAIEPMTVGTPAVVSDRGALPEVVDGGRAGLVFPAGDPAALAREVLRLEDGALRAALVARAHEHVRTRFGYERWADEVQELLERAVPARARGGAP